MTIEEFAKRVLQYTDQLVQEEGDRLLPSDIEKLNKLKAKLKSEIDSGYVDTGDVWDFVRGLPYKIMYLVGDFYQELCRANTVTQRSKNKTNNNLLSIKREKPEYFMGQEAYNVMYSNEYKECTHYTHKIPYYPYKSTNIVDLLEEVELVWNYMKQGYFRPQEIEKQMFFDALQKQKTNVR